MKSAGNCNPRHQVGTSGVLNNSSGYHRIAPCTRSYSEVLKSPTPYTRPTVSTDVHPDPDVGAGETPTDDQSAIENTNTIHITRKDIACLTDGEHTNWNAKAIQRDNKNTARRPDSAGYATATTTTDDTPAATLADGILAATAADDTTAAIAANDTTAVDDTTAAAAANDTPAVEDTTAATAANDTSTADVTTPAIATNNTAADNNTAAIAVNGIIAADDNIATTVVHDPGVITAADEPTATTATDDATTAAAVDGLGAARNTSAVNDNTAADDSHDASTSSNKADNRPTENVNNDVRNLPVLVNTGDSPRGSRRNSLPAVNHVQSERWAGCAGLQSDTGQNRALTRSQSLSTERHTRNKQSCIPSNWVATSAVTKTGNTQPSTLKAKKVNNDGLALPLFHNHSTQ